ncbi:MAG: helix-turn-helix domain-containing protein, partial [Deltaproteobacteria bacterium]|nr:helix-turn-helix domain-containing protein [Deltaproteobacteria bacterium]
TLEEAARYLKVASVTLYRKARRGEVPAARLGKSWRFHRGQLENWIQQQASLHDRRDRTSSAAMEASFRHLSTRETNAVLNLIRRLKSDYSRELERILLYGSRARGDFRGDSDIDLAVIVKPEDPFLKKEISEKAGQLSYEEGVMFQVLVFSKKEWENPSFKTFLLVERIQREGIKIYG